MTLCITLAAFLLISGGVSRNAAQQDEPNFILDFIRQHLHIAQSKVQQADYPSSETGFVPAPAPQPSYLGPVPTPPPAPIPVPQPSYPAPVSSTNSVPYVQPTPSLPPQPAYTLAPTPPNAYEPTPLPAGTPPPIPSAPGPPSFAVNPVPVPASGSQDSIPPCESWSEWSACNAQCGQGTRKRNRHCGYKMETITQTCLTQPCA